MAGQVTHGLHHAARAAAIEMALGPLEQGPKIEGLGGITLIVMQHDAAAKFRCAEFIAERGGARAARAIIQLKAAAAGRRQMADH